MRASACPACKAEERPTWEHYIEACPALDAVVSRHVEGTPWQPLSRRDLAARLHCPQQNADVHRAIALCGVLRRTVAAISARDAELRHPPPGQ